MSSGLEETLFRLLLPLFHSPKEKILKLLTERPRIKLK